MGPCQEICLLTPSLYNTKHLTGLDTRRGEEQNVMPSVLELVISDLAPGGGEWLSVAFHPHNWF